MNTVVTEAWRTIVPHAEDKNGPPVPLLLSLTIVTGMVDAFSYLALGHVFVANMTGNVVFLAFALAGAKGFSLAASLTAVAAFLVGAGVGGRLSVAFGRHRGRLLLMVCSLETLLVAASAVMVSVVHNPGSGPVRYAVIAVLSVSMGTQNATARHLAVADITTSVLTMTITGMSADSRLAGGDGSKVGRRLVSALSMFLGALVGALLVLKVGRPAAILAALGLLCAIVVSTAVAARSPRDWVRPPT